MPGKKSGPHGPTKVEEDGSYRVGKNRVYDPDTGKVRKRLTPKWNPKTKRWS